MRFWSVAEEGGERKRQKSSQAGSVLKFLHISDTQSCLSFSEMELVWCAVTRYLYNELYCLFSCCYFIFSSICIFQYLLIECLIHWGVLFQNTFESAFHGSVDKIMPSPMLNIPFHLKICPIMEINWVVIAFMLTKDS